MSDLFDQPAATPSGDVPPHGSLSHAAERHLFESDHAMWVRYITPRYLEIANGPDGMAWLAEGFENVMSRALQRAIWAQLSESQQQDITRRVEIIRAERAAAKPSSDKDTAQ